MTTPPVRGPIAYLGTPELAVPPLRALVTAGHDVRIVVSAPDRRRGRGASTMPSPVKAAALDLGLTVTDDLDGLIGSGAGLGVVVAYGRLLRRRHLDAMPFVNLHFSLLPRWRGAAPVERAILAGDERTGVCLMEVTEGLDEGGVYALAETAVDDKSLEGLRAELVAAGTGLLLDALRDGFGEATPQRGEVTYATKVDPEERRIDWSRPAAEIARVVRIGGAWTTLDGSRLRVVAARPVEVTLAPGALEGVVVGTGAAGLELLEVQAEGRAVVGADAWRRGARLADGVVLGS